MKISEIAKITGVTIKTLYHYEKIGLLKPSNITESGYRVYSNEDLGTLQQILFFKELDFSLNEIKEILTNKNYNKEEALVNQRELLKMKKKRLEDLIDLINKSIKGDFAMSFKEFNISEIENAKNEYAKEVKSKWGNTEAYKECNTKTKNYDEKKWGGIGEEGENILFQISQIREGSPKSIEAQYLVEAWRSYITKNFYNCTKEILIGLGTMYVEDERFKENIDKNGKGTAEFLYEAIVIYCNS